MADQTFTVEANDTSSIEARLHGDLVTITFAGSSLTIWKWDVAKLSELALTVEEHIGDVEAPPPPVLDIPIPPIEPDPIPEPDPEEEPTN